MTIKYFSGSVDPQILGFYFRVKFLPYLFSCLFSIIERNFLCMHELETRPESWSCFHYLSIFILRKCLGLMFFTCNMKINNSNCVVTFPSFCIIKISWKMEIATMVCDTLAYWASSCCLKNYFSEFIPVIQIWPSYMETNVIYQN